VPWRLSTEGATVVVATLNREEYLANTLLDLLDQDQDPIEILIVDQSDAPSRASLDMQERYPDKITYHKVTFRGLPLARNFGWQNARHDAIVYVDDDIRCGRQLVSQHTVALRKKGVGVVAGGIEEPNRPRPMPRNMGEFVRWTATPIGGFDSKQERYIDQARGCNFSTWKRVLEEVGGFDESLNVGAALYEELEYCLRVKKAGYGVFFSPNARLTHLIAPDNGCRVPDAVKYVHSYAHNKSVVIRRYLTWYQKPTALLHIGKVALAYSWANKNPLVVPSVLSGTVRGFAIGAKPVQCTQWPRDTG